MFAGRTRGVFFDTLSFSSTDVEQKLLKPKNMSDRLKSCLLNFHWICKLLHRD